MDVERRVTRFLSRRSPSSASVLHRLLRTDRLGYFLERAHWQSDGCCVRRRRQGIAGERAKWRIRRLTTACSVPLDQRRWRPAVYAAPFDEEGEPRVWGIGHLEDSMRDVTQHNLGLAQIYDTKFDDKLSHRAAQRRLVDGLLRALSDTVCLIWQFRFLRECPGKIRGRQS